MADSSLTASPVPGHSELEAAARTVLARCDELAAFTETPGIIWRPFCCRAMHEVHGRLRTWMAAAGLNVSLDALCNLIGRWEPPDAGGHATRKVVLGSHVDTVVNAGRYDGVLGVVLSLAAAELAVKILQPPFELEVIAFSEEEGIRYRTPFLGSRAVAGTFDPDLLDRTDESGVAMRQAIRDFGGDIRAIDAAAYAPSSVLAFLEPHIEQGPILEEEGLPVGVVDSIVGQTRASVLFTGQAGHAGTAPMNRRRDALAAAARFVTAVEELGRAREGLVATVGRIEVEPNVANVIARQARLRLDMRHPSDKERGAALAELNRQGGAIAGQTGTQFAIEWSEELPAVRFDPRLVDVLSDCVQTAGVPPRAMASGAGHDAAILAERFPAAMLFIRCRGGVSHHPDEHVELADVTTALEIMVRAVAKLAEIESP